MMVAASTQLADHAQALAQRGAIGEAYALLKAGVSAQDPEAAALLAAWRLAGNQIRRDLAEARDLYGMAAAWGKLEARTTYLALLANGAGGNERNWPEVLASLAAASSDGGSELAERQLGLIAAMQLDRTGEPTGVPEPLNLHPVPMIERFAGFLSEQECHYLIDLALPLLEPALVIDPRTGGFIRDPIRTAMSAAFPFVREDPVLHAINRRIAAVTGTSYEQGEPLQVLSYEPGEEYKLHSDALPPGHNQRRQTFLVTLSNGFEGGETVFPRLGLALRGAVGDALHFYNVNASGQPDELAWHAGAPVTKGRKLLLSKWIREAPLDLSGPPGRPF